MINKDNREIILTLSCPDTSGIVAEVASFMADQGLTIKESNQFGDIEGLIKNAEEIKQEKKKNTIINSQQDIRISLELVKLKNG